MYTSTGRHRSPRRPSLPGSSRLPRRCQRAFWVGGIKLLGQGATKIPFKAPYAEALIGRFLDAANYEFECSVICGRKFDGVADHTNHLRAGGCARILEAPA